MLDSYLSYFEIPQLVVEVIRVKMSNSLKLFVENIRTSLDDFPAMRFANDSAKSARRSVKLFEFETRYNQFCSKFGFTQLIVE